MNDAPKKDAAPADGGPAFSRAGFANAHVSMDRGARGISVRDYFASAALQGLLSSANPGRTGTDDLSRDAYAIADAMLTERTFAKEPAAVS
jgi:hypothetical protein